MRRLAIAALTVAMLCLVGGGIAYAMSTQRYQTHLRGSAEVPVRATNAQGQALVRLSADGETLHYKLIVANIENVWMAHLHLAPAGVNGPIVVWLHPDAGPPPAGSLEGRTSGILAEGHITAADLVGPLAGQPLSALVDAIEVGNVYVNVHTNDFVDPANTGPGDFPGGEIRGQLHEH